MPKWLRLCLINGGLVLASVIGTLAVLETTVFKYVLVPDDVLRNVTIGGVVRYEPDTRAVFRHPDGRETLVTINADGWNSTKPRYKVERTPGVLRVAVIGDSYVHGGFVDVGDGFPEVMESALNKAGTPAEVFRFGMDGAPLSQYLHMLRREVRRFKPDVVVIMLIHNDFDETYRFLQTRYASSFLKLGANAAGVVLEYPPADFAPGLADRFRELRTFRYLYYETNAYLALKSLVSRIWWGGNEDWAPEFVSSGVDIRRISDHDKNDFFAHYVMREMKAIAAADGFKIVFVMDGVREAVYDGKPAHKYEVGRLNLVAADVARRLELPFLDLQETFRADYERRCERFEFAYDWHWNVLGNRLVGDAVVRFLTTDPRLLGPRTTTAASEGPPVSR